MSVSKTNQALMPSDVVLQKGKSPLVCLSLYSTPMALLADAHCDIVLVGDSVGMVVHGLSSTLEVTLDMMILHGQAVRRGLKKALLVIDLPFGSYEQGPQAAFETAVRVMRETSCHAVKLEGGRLMAETIRYLVARGIPVMGHVGLTPQSIHVLGGYKVQGRGSDSERILQDAIAVADAGAFAVVLEKVPESLARDVTCRVPIPTIGIGASSACDGQILVIDDMLGLLFSAFQPEFVKRYAELGVAAEAALERYAEDVRTRSFVSNRHTFYDSRANDELALF